MLSLQEKLAIDRLAAVIDKLSPNDQTFGNDLINKARQYQHISEKQLYWVGVLTNRVTDRAQEQAARLEAAPVVLKDDSIARIISLFAIAKGHGLKQPKIRLFSPGGQRLVVKQAGPSSRYIGQLLVTDDQGYGGAYFGRIDQGRFVASGKATPDVEQALREMGEDPAKTASAYGRRTGACCFCGLTLTDGRSIAVGYGPICAGKYGLPWGDERAEAGTVTVTQE